MGAGKGIKLQVLICTYGVEGINRVATTRHPLLEGVQYVVSWQLPGSDCDIPDELKRDDFIIVKNGTKGLSRNRNIAVEAASAPVCLIADDDLDYFDDGLRYVMEVFDRNPDMDIATFQYEGADCKYYPAHEADLRNPPKNYYVSSVEIAFRLDPVKKSGVRFDERFGVGSKFVAGEEDLWLHGLLDRGLKGRYYPVKIAVHKGETTGVRLGATREYIESKGAVFRYIYPVTWPFRMIMHAMRSRKTGWKLGKLTYCKEWLRGVLEVSKKV